MKKFTKFGLSTTLVLAGFTLLSACSSSENTSSGKQAIEVFSTKTENATTLKELAREFTKANPNITVNVTAPADGGTVLKTRLTKNDIPDVISGGGDATFLQLEKASVLKDQSSETYVKDIQSSYLKQMKVFTGTAKVYGVPYATNASGLIYNKDIFDKYGLSYPKTWAEFVKINEVLKSKGVTPLELDFQGADNWTTMCVWNSVAPALEPVNFGKDRLASKTSFVSDMKPVAQRFIDVIKLGQSNYMGTSYNDGLAAFAQGKAAMLINGSWTIPVIRQTNKTINFGIVPFPTTNDTSKNTLSSGVDVLLAIGKNSKHQEADKKFVTFMLKKEQAAKYIKEQAAFSAITGVDQTDSAMTAASKEIAGGHVSDFPDHLYPAGFNMASLLSGIALNENKNMPASENISQFLKTADQQYDIANTKK
ncbi:MAG: extracellular solute-binding protein [Streptococcaceae bacterium]|jgi:raffinose/stachyose/melibiose transport system substrate-binding protein|nr:extracellular solute-binding protein [Streptococcaceae bacterium]